MGPIIDTWETPEKHVLVFRIWVDVAYSISIEIISIKFSYN